MITDDLRKKWKHRISVVIDADNNNNIRLNQQDKWIISELQKSLNRGEDLSFCESRHLNRIFGLVG